MQLNSFRLVFKHYFALPVHVEMPGTSDLWLSASDGNAVCVLLKKILTCPQQFIKGASIPISSPAPRIRADN